MDARTAPDALATLDARMQRRQRLAATMAAQGGGLAIVPTAPTRVRNADGDHPYRFDSSFHYLTGFAEPEAWLLLESTGRTTLACRPHDAEQEIWNGKRLGPEAAPAVLGVQAAVPVADLDATVVPLLGRAPQVWVSFADEALRARLDGWLARVRAAAERGGAEVPPVLRDLDPLLAEMRLFKDEVELATMRRAATISADAHVRAMRLCGARFRAEPNGRIAEYEIEAELLHEFRRRGASGPAYGSIVGGGANACILHYEANDAWVGAHDLVLIDAACELDGYAADITRTFPAGGRFSGEQRAVYDVVLAAQAASIAATRPGARRVEQHAASVRVLTQGLFDLGLLTHEKHGSVDDAIASGAFLAYYMHGTGHWLGLDVHDCGAYVEVSEAPVEQSNWRGGTVVRRPSRILQPGMVCTIEPGLYVRPAENVPERFWNIGVRIEDDVVVTPAGCEILSRGVPVAAGEIEALMREAA